MLSHLPDVENLPRFREPLSPVKIPLGCDSTVETPSVWLDRFAHVYHVISPYYIFYPQITTCPHVGLRSAERNAGCAGRVKWTRLGVTPL